MDEQTPLLPDAVDSKPIQDQEHSVAKAAFELALGDMPYGDVYASMVALGFRWREAAFVAWAVQTKEQRVPKTKKELADMLGCGASKITDMERDRRLVAMRVRFAKLVYVDALPEIIAASVEVASKPSYKATPERNNIINKVLELGTERLQVDVAQSQAENFDELSDEELAALAGERLGVEEEDE